MSTPNTCGDCFAFLHPGTCGPGGDHPGRRVCCPRDCSEFTASGDRTVGLCTREAANRDVGPAAAPVPATTPACDWFRPRGVEFDAIPFSLDLHGRANMADEYFLELERPESRDALAEILGNPALRRYGVYVRPDRAPRATGLTLEEAMDYCRRDYEARPELH